MNALHSLLDRLGPDPDPGVLSWIAGVAAVAQADPAVARAIVKELAAQRAKLKMIASENYCSLAVQAAMGNLLTDKYAEGFPGHRFYAACEQVDAIEGRAVELARSVFGAEHAYVQPHSGADANLVAYWAILCKRVREPSLASVGGDPNRLDRAAWNRLREELGRQKLVGLGYNSGGHLTHGYRHNVSAHMFDCAPYEVDPVTQRLDYDAIRRLVLQERPLILLAGFSAYPRRIDFRRMRTIADEVGATFMVDMAHFAGLVAGKVFQGDFDPVPHAHVVTTTTHKTLRGPRGGLILCKREYAEWMDKGCPLVLGGPLPHVVAAKAVALEEASRPAFRAYAQAVVDNAQALAAGLMQEGMTLTSGGTENHLMVVDLRPFGLCGRQAERALLDAGIALNRNTIPNDPAGAWYTSGLRLGTPALTTLGMGPREMRRVAGIIRSVLAATRPEPGPDGAPSRTKFRTDPAVLARASGEVQDLLAGFPLYPGLDAGLLESLVPGAG